MAEQVMEAAYVGMGTYKSAAGSLADSSLLTVLGLSVLPDTPNAVIKGADIRVVTGTVFIENDGTAADANAMPFISTDTTIYRIRNNRGLLLQLRFFASAAYDIRIALVA